MNKQLTPAERRELDAALCGDGQRLRGNSIVQEFSEGPLPMLLDEPIVLVEDIEVGVPDIDDSDIPY